MKPAVISAVASLLAWGIAPERPHAAVFQFAVAVETDKGLRDAFLWIPPEAEYVRGIVIGGMTLAERELVKDRQIREACAAEQLALVFFKCGLGSVDVPGTLQKLADASGYEELSAAPLFFVGHSAGGPQAKALAIEMAPRCFGLVQYRGGVPGGEDPVPPGVPALMMVGQFDEFGGTMRDGAGRENWEGALDALAEFRSADERNLGSIVIEPGAGHFAWSDRNAAYLALFLRKAAAARLPAARAAEVRPVRLREIDPSGGWSVDLSTISSADRLATAPCNQFSGDSARSAWAFDREMAEATIAYHAGGFGRVDQFIRWEDPHWVDAGARFFFTRLDWVGDGQQFEVHPVYSDVFPGQYKGRGPRWLEAGKPVGNSGAPIQVRHVSGPVVVAGPNRLRVRFDSLAPATESARVTFLACSEGDENYRYSEQVGMMPRGFSGVTKGMEQVIRFPPPADLRLGGEPLRLKAHSDSGLPVEFYVAHGPARVVGERLEIAEIPRRARFPIAVKVVAWQFGRAIEPQVTTAEPVERSLRVLRR